jgi:hypothetical protein
MVCTSLIVIIYLYLPASYFANLSCFVFVLLLVYCNILGFRLIRGFRGSTGFGFGDGFLFESGFGTDLGFRFGFRFCMPTHLTRSESVPLPSLLLRIICVSAWFTMPALLTVHYLLSSEHMLCFLSDGSWNSIWCSRYQDSIAKSFFFVLTNKATNMLEFIWAWPNNQLWNS